MAKSKKSKYLSSLVFDDTAELLDYLESPEGMPKLSSKWMRSMSSIEGSEEFTGTRSFQHAVDLAREGWPEGREKMEGKLSGLTPYVQSSARMPVETLDVAGYAPNVPAYCAGSPACMWSRDGDDVSGRAPVVRFLVNISMSFRITSDEIFNRGAALCAAIEYLEATDRRCEVVACCRLDDDLCTQDVFVTLKRAEEHPELDRLAMFLAHPSILRRLIFRLNELDDKLFAGLVSHRGVPKDIEPEYGQVYLPAGKGWQLSGCDTPKHAMAAVLDQLQEAMDPASFASIGRDWEDAMAALRG